MATYPQSNYYDVMQPTNTPSIGMPPPQGGAVPIGTDGGSQYNPGMPPQQGPFTPGGPDDPRLAQAQQNIANGTQDPNQWSGQNMGPNIGMPPTGAPQTGQANPQSPWSQLPPTSGNQDGGGTFAGQRTVGANAGPADYAGVQGFSDAANDYSRRYLDPQQEAEQRRLQQELVNRGLDPFSQQGQQMMDDMSRRQGDQNSASAFEAMGFGQGIQNQMFNQSLANTQQAGNMQQAQWANDTNRRGQDNAYNLGQGNLELGRQQQDFGELMGYEGLNFRDAQFNEGNNRWDQQMLRSLLPGGGMPQGNNAPGINPNNQQNPYDAWGQWAGGSDYWGLGGGG